VQEFDNIYDKEIKDIVIMS